MCGLSHQTCYQKGIYIDPPPSKVEKSAYVIRGKLWEGKERKQQIVKKGGKAKRKGKLKLKGKLSIRITPYLEAKWVQKE
jgi:hypothetical protein